VSGFIEWVVNRLGPQGELVWPLILSLWIAWGDVRTHRIPNYLTLGTALAGLAFQLGAHGWPGLKDGFLGMVLGLVLLILPYLKGAMGAGDVKALAALGAWLGPERTFHLFLYMALAGGFLSLGVWWWQGLLWAKLRQGRVWLVNWFLSGPHRPGPAAPPSPRTKGVPYGVALALGMGLFFLLNG
jgi:prepilin peptidase CpaA